MAEWVAIGVIAAFSLFGSTKVIEEYVPDPEQEKKINQLKEGIKNEGQKFRKELKKSEEELEKIKIEGEKSKKEFIKKLQNLAKENKHIEDLFKKMEQDHKKASKELSVLKERCNRPILERKQKVQFVNNLKLKIRRTQNILLAGPKGSGKSTFLWLLDKGPKPEKSYDDGTIEFISNEGFTDTIGMEWTSENILKLYTIFLYQGFPKDIIIFSNDRISTPLSQLMHYHIAAPMIVVLKNSFWKKYRKLEKKANEVKDETALKEEMALKFIYDLETHNHISEVHFGKAVTHKMNIYAISDHRKNKFDVIGELMKKIGGAVFKISESKPQCLGRSDHLREMLFRFIYIFEKKYKKNVLDFMNKASFMDI